MRVLHVIATLDPTAGGPPAVAARLAAAQAAAGASPAIAAYAEPGAERRVADSLTGIPGIDGVRLVRITPERGRLARITAPGARATLGREILSADVLHLHGVWDSILRVAAAEARRAAKPYVVTAHGMLDPWSLGQSPSKRLKKRLALALGYRRMLDGAAFLHTLNGDERDLLAPLGLRARAEVFPNGVFPDEFASPPPRGTFGASRPELGDSPYVLFLSRIHYKKGLDFLADAFARVLPGHPRARLVVAGPDGGELAPFRTRCERLGIERSVLVVGPLYGPDKLAALSGAACFCLPSRQEGFSMAVTEALACATPVVISEACHFPEVREAGAGHVVPLEVVDVADALNALLADPPAARAMGEAGRRLVAERFTWPVIARAMLRAYADAAGRAREPGPRDRAAG